jgi:hypothetical protein
MHSPVKGWVLIETPDSFIALFANDDLVKPGVKSQWH